MKNKKKKNQKKKGQSKGKEDKRDMNKRHYHLNVFSNFRKESTQVIALTLNTHKKDEKKLRRHQASAPTQWIESKQTTMGHEGGTA